MRKFLDYLVPASYREALTDEFTIRDNPIEQRDIRRGRRRRDFFWLQLLALSAIWLAFTAVAWLVHLIVAEHHLNRGVPSWAGGSYGALLLIVVSCIHICFIYQAAWRQTHTFFLQEFRKNTLGALLGTRTSPLQLVLQATVFPFKQAMYVAFAGLPFYAFAYSLGGVRPADVLGLYAVYTIISIRPPRWLIPAFGGQSIEQAVKANKSGRAATWNEWIFRNLIWVVSVTFTLQGYFAIAFGSGWFERLVTPLWRSIPPNVTSIAWLILISWPLAITRWLFTPQPFYAMSVPPAVYVIPLSLIGRFLVAWCTSLFLRVGQRNQLSRLWDSDAFARSQAANCVLVVFAALGYLWRPYVLSGMTASLLYTGKASSGGALAGLFWLLMSGGILIMWLRSAAAAGALDVLKRDPKPNVETAARLEKAPGRLPGYIFSPPAMAIGIYMAACLCATTWPFPSEVLSLVIPMLAVGAAGTVLFAGMRLFTRYYVFPLTLPLAALALPFGAPDAWVAAACPLTGIICLSEHAARIERALAGDPKGIPAWYISSLVCAVVGVWLGWRGIRRWAKLSESQKPVAAVTAPDSESRPVLTGAVSSVETQLALHEDSMAAVTQTLPAELIRNSDRDVPVSGTKKRRMAARRDTEEARRLVKWAQERWDSAVMAKEMRVLFRGHLGKDEVYAAATIALALVAVIAYYHDMTSEVLRPAAQLMYGDGIIGIGSIIGGLGGLPSIILTLIMPEVASTIVARAFGRERERSSLGFLLTTPLSTDEILLGKMFGLLSPSLFVLAVMIAWNILFSALMIPFVGPLNALIGFAAASLAPCAITVCGALLGLASSTLFRKETDAASLAVFLSIGLDFLVVTVLWTLYALAPGLSTLPPFFWVLAWVATSIAALAAVLPISWSLARWRLDGARRGDIQMESAPARR